MSVDVILKAKEYATMAHASIDQRRKYTNEPYIVHPEKVAYLVSLVTDNANAIAAAWLHDVMEDVNNHYGTDKAIIDNFGTEIYLMVYALTDKSTPADGNREARKEIERVKLATCSPIVQTIKLADLIDNTCTIVKYDHNFAKVYLTEKSKLLDVMHRGSAILSQIASNLVIRGFGKLVNAAYDKSSDAEEA